MCVLPCSWQYIIRISHICIFELCNALILGLYLREFFPNSMKIHSIQICLLMMLCFVEFSRGLVIDCETLHGNLTDLIQKETGSDDSDEIKCSRQLLMKFANFTFIDGVKVEVAGDNSMLVINDVELTDARVRDWLVYAFLGKHFVDVEAQSTEKYFTYVESTGQVKRNLLKCEFQQTLYLTLIVILILLLVSVLVWDAILEGQRKKEEEDTEIDKNGGGRFARQQSDGHGANFDNGPKLNFRIPYTFHSA